MGLDRARERGVPLGNPAPLPSLHRARALHAAQARQHAADLRALIDYCRDQGQSLRATARLFTERNIPTLRGGAWQAAQLTHILRRPYDPCLDPFRIPGPAVISFSGGRTSAFLLAQIIRAHGGTLPDDLAVVFANTGKERLETLDFVAECADRWAVPVVWLEYDPTAPHHTKITSYQAASRDGLPYQQAITAKRFLPNPVTRFCTFELKVKRIEAYARHWLGWRTWWNVTGIRYDEPRRVAKVTHHCPGCVIGCSRSGPRAVLPLHRARFIEADILAWWRAQPFDLRLQSHEGNCDLCFLKGAGKILRIMADRPDLAAWWMDQEARQLGTTDRAKLFRFDRPSYADLLATAVPAFVTEEDWEGEDCSCTD